MPLPEDRLGAALGNEINNATRAVTERVKRYHALPPVNKSLFRASGGAALVVSCLYVAVELKARAGELVTMFLRAPLNAPEGVWVPLAVWAACLGFGLLWFVVGVRNVGDARDTMRAFFSGLLAAGFAALLWLEAYPSPEMQLPLQGLYIAGLTGFGVRFWLSVWRPGGGPELEAVRRQQAHGRAREATPTETAARLREDGERRRRRQFRD